MTQPVTDCDVWITRMVKDHGSAVRGYLLGLVRHADLADDLAQETFQRLWMARERYNDQGQERSYLLRIADRLVIDHARRNRQRVTIDPQDWQGKEPVCLEQEPLEALVGSEEREQLGVALAALSEPQKRVLLLRYFGELDFQQIAQTLGCPLGTALSHCRRGLLALRKLLEGGEIS